MGNDYTFKDSFIFFPTDYLHHSPSFTFQDGSLDIEECEKREFTTESFKGNSDSESNSSLLGESSGSEDESDPNFHPNGQYLSSTQHILKLQKEDTEKPEWLCIACNELFTNLARAEQHVIEMQYLFICYFCKRRFSTSQSLEEHEHDRHDVSRLHLHYKV
ncbi:hypothetical protein M422DRAFT_785538 [Sphaerobolus stellatus SS14]|uniref:C2H2-type domain-containing protein n=1 Tax=Sphaerobolus stellatus (strain SS14) TaxID=990650 RepID=A0A0C9TUJ6_SPHS4|nr:hypothetical protein M422DRAFT_785538 [Sphaerobolus stellatus SS14]